MFGEVDDRELHLGGGKGRKESGILNVAISFKRNVATLNKGRKINLDSLRENGGKFWRWKLALISVGVTCKTCHLSPALQV